VYVYRVLVDAKTLDAKKFLSVVTKSSRAKLCSTEDIRNTLEYGIDFSFQYFDEKNKFIGTVKTSAKDCSTKVL